ncbi:hypothetical protein J416_07832 [Gracilibacillus halophilus YIM-C55.5]|uniref:YneQ n=1 Tax=Gracilibacillus halophilus YIM-C55.5 TaxID=1308866 RepID=N4WLC1_9BACI|nr:hypothetical protein [Gracilibacillus halophilus]ENH96972.1 hypothetical protein J416_07832 [Gracilibacillus halophilus YIM-C55.5]
MAFGLRRKHLQQWKKDVKKGKISFLTHYWMDDRFPNCKTVTKVGCSDYQRLADWGKQYGLRKEWIHNDPVYPHFDLFGEYQRKILKAEQQWDQIHFFNLI